MNPEVDKFLRRTKTWRKEFEKLREIILGCGLTEELKWGVPCYTFQNKNVVLIHGFKEYCAILFIKGALLHDAKGILIRQTEHVQAGRHVRFTNVHDITAISSILKSYIEEAIEVERAGLKVSLKKTKEFPVADELKMKFKELPKLKTAFDALTPGRQHAYLLYFAQPKQSKTRIACIEKYEKKILNGKGLQD